jgi:hypothetical protein
MHYVLSSIFLTRSTIIGNENQFCLYGEDMLCMSCSRINQDGAVHDGISVFTFDCMSLTSYEFDKWMNKLHVQVQC